MVADPLREARALLQASLIHYRGRPIGTRAALDQSRLAAANYEECFVRDFVVSALVCLNDGDPTMVGHFLETIPALRRQQRTMAGHEVIPGVLPASFRVEVGEDGEERLLADFGERAIGRVAPVDGMMWWVVLLGAYVKATGDRDFLDRPGVAQTLREVLHLLLKDGFEVFPTLLVPDGAFMIDRRMGVYGHPLEIQSLFYAALRTAETLLQRQAADQALLATVLKRRHVLRSYVRLFYWLDLERLNEIHRYDTEQFGTGSVNMLNIYPESIPDWLVDWLPEDGGYLVGNLGPGRMDFRFFAYGNLLAVLFDLATEEEANRLMNLYEDRWNDLVGAMPLKIVYPAAAGTDWQLITGSDPKNVPWSYHNGGNWPVLLWAFVAACLKVGRRELAQRAYALATEQLAHDDWPEYYDGRHGRLVGRRSNLRQTWSAAGLVIADQLLADDQRCLSLFP